MGWGRMLLLGNIGQQLDIHDTGREIESLRREIRGKGFQETTQKATLERLVRENEELKLYLAAVVRLLIAKGVATREELARIVDAVDREDGSIDRRHRGKI